MLADLAGNMRQDLVAVFELDLEHGVGKALPNRPLDLDRVALGRRRGAPLGLIASHAFTTLTKAGSAPTSA